MSSINKYLKYRNKYLELKQQIGAARVSFAPTTGNPISGIQRRVTGANEWKDSLKYWGKRILGKSLHRFARKLYTGELDINRSNDPSSLFNASVYFYNDDDDTTFKSNNHIQGIYIGYALNVISELIITNKDLINNQIPRLLYFSLKKIIDDNKDLKRKGQLFLDSDQLEKKVQNEISKYIDENVGSIDTGINNEGFKIFPVMIVNPSNDDNDIYIDDIYKKYSNGITIDGNTLLLPNRENKENIRLNTIMISGIRFKTLVYRD